MTLRIFLLSLATPLLLLATSACGDAAGKRYPDYRYRLTVEVETPEGIKSGSSVIEVSKKVTSKYSIPNAGSVISRVKGEAVAVDLGKRGVLFALLRSEYDLDWASRAMWLVTDLATYQDAKAAREALGDKNANLSDIQFELNLERAVALKGRHDLPRYKDTAFTRASAKADGKPLPSAYPMLVTFDDFNVPESVQLVDPDDLGASFGRGVRLKRITFERTDDPVNLGIEKRLTWLKAVGEKRGTLIPNPPRYLKDTTPIQLVSPSDFNTELFR
jgi:hypothetical protein